MTILSRKIDESIQIGHSLSVMVTDIDRSGVRLYVRGRCVGGFNDGESVDRAFELGAAGELKLGDLVTITLARIATNEPRVYLGINAPKHLIIERNKTFDANSRKKREQE
jgi:sRNA-binding carbon storage regulator CsrA